MKLFVWDFHGVLEKDNEKAVIEISNRVLADLGYKERFSEEDNERFYGLKWHEYFERLLPQLPPAEHLKLQAACFAFTEKNLHILAKHIKPNDHAPQVLEKIARAGHRQVVISNTRPADLIWFLNAVGLREFFADEEIIGVNAHQTHHTKTDALQAYLKETDFEKIVVIGDSEDDLKLGRTTGATTYFYKHPHRRHADTQDADHVTSDLRAVLQEL